MRRTLIAVLLLIAALPAVANALPPRPPGPIKTLAALKELSTAKPLSMDGYSRLRFPHWIDEGNGCDTRKLVLIRDGSNVKVGRRCRIVSVGSPFTTGSGLRQRPYEQPTDRGQRVLEPLEERPGSGGLEATTAQGLVSVLAVVDSGQGDLATQTRAR